MSDGDSARAPVVEQVRAVLRAQLAPRLPATFGVACSGGADSLVLADAAALALGEAAVVVLHVDHGLSAESSSQAARLVAWARGRGLAAAVRRVTVGPRASLEAAARQARYRALCELAEELGLSALVTAHTARDQAETVLLRILRGTGVAGLAGIAAASAWPGLPLLRPLLGLSRATVDEYAAARGLPVWDDLMNGDERFARVRVRRHLLPRLREENPAVDAALLRLAEHAAEWTSAIDELAAPLAARLSARQLAAAAPAVRKRALALALGQRALGFEAAHLEALDALVCRSEGGSAAISLPGGIAVRQYDELRILPHEEHGDARSLDGEPPDRNPGGVPDELDDASQFSVRRWRPGDRMRPARLGGRSRKLSDLFIDAKVPRALRGSARVVCRRSDDSIVWVEHLGFAHGASPRRGSLRVDPADAPPLELAVDPPLDPPLDPPVDPPVDPPLAPPFGGPAEKGTFSKSRDSRMLQPSARVLRLTERKP